MFLGDVALYDAAELASFYRACVWAVRKGLDIGSARRRFAESAKPRLRPHWEILSADRDGRPTLRCWRLPRMAWPGLAVWDHCGGSGSGGGRYELTTIDHDSVCISTGLRFSNMRQLADHLFSTTR
jgi:hypothetical protein